MRSRRSLVLLFSNWLTLIAIVLLFSYITTWQKYLTIPRSEWIAVVQFSIGLVLITFVIAALLSLVQYLLLFKGENQVLNKMHSLVNHLWTDISLDDEKEGLYADDKLDKAIADLKNQLQSLVVATQKQYAKEDRLNGETKSDIVKQERQRIARELHDSVSQQLFAMTMLLSALNESSDELPAQTRIQLGQVTKMVNSAQAEMRALLLHLRPITLESNTLAQGIERLVVELDTKVQISFETRLEEVYLSEDVENHLFRIVQELLSNALRHAKATLIECELIDQPQTAILRFIDDGIGFDVENASKSSGYGLNNISERIGQMGGTLKIISLKDQGTSIEIAIPKIELDKNNEEVTND